MEMHFYNREYYPTYEAAKEAGAIYSCDAPLCEDQFDQWGFRGGILADAMQAVYAALECANMQTYISAVVVDGGKVIKEWGDEDET